MDEIVRIFDTTLRDGEQSPGFSMTPAEKLELARQLEALRVDVIEAGFPISSPGDLDAVRAVARDVRGTTVAALARANPQDVDAAIEALRPAARPRVHVFNATSPIHM
ncbi:MAG: 2-isopropylmalate synthase, partial [bacterium]